ncbi:jhamt [Cordylochernes scorpioides]|uniref:Jhamt n=1 Tax=Cordylochernes scorpioides TaxID=51811 RepID=A0ABY6LIS0_9ARAC|nr:jhamt [Cordylochernes scorpioides]
MLDHPVLHYTRCAQDVDKFIPDTHNSPQPAFYFSQILQDNGLDVLSCETINLTYSFNNAQILKVTGNNEVSIAITTTRSVAATMESVNPFSERITDPQERAEFLTDCLKEISTMRTNQNDYTFNYSLLVAQAERR